jgi:hypothetical protein
MPTLTEAEPLEDDGEMLWASPTHGEPLSLEYVPGGAQILLIARLSNIVRSNEGQRVLQALGSDFQGAYGDWQAAAGVRAENVDTVALGFYGNDGQFPRISLLIQLRDRQPMESLLHAWGDPQPVTVGSSTFYAGSNWAYAVPAGREGSVFVMGHRTEIEELTASEFRPPPLRREFTRLLAMTDSERHVNLLFAPRFLFGDGQPLLRPLDGVYERLETLVGDDMRAGLLSLHFGQAVFFVEFQGEFDAEVGGTTASLQLRDRVAGIPRDVELALAARQPSPYWSLVALRYPSMLRFMVKHLRAGVDCGLPTLNVVLPPVAAHNFVFGAERMLFPSSSELQARLLTGRESQQPASLRDALETTMSIRFDQESLESASASIASEFRSLHGKLPFDFKIIVVGDDLKQEGITRNQQIRGFDHVDKTVAEIITMLVVQANPVAVSDPSDPQQRLVWVVGTDPDDPAREVILITTRNQAAVKYTIPEIFR